MSIDVLLQAIMGSADSTKKGEITEQTGLSAGLAQSAITLVMGKLLAGGQPDTRPAAATTAGEFTSGVAGTEAPSLNSLLERMRSQGSVDETALTASGLPQELSAKAGIDLPQAIKAIEAILGLLTGKKAATTTKRRKAASTKSATKPKAKAKTATKPKTTAKAKTTTKSKTKPKTATKAKTVTKPKTATKRKTTTKPKTATKPKAKAKTTTKSGKWTVTG